MKRSTDRILTNTPAACRVPRISRLATKKLWQRH